MKQCECYSLCQDYLTTSGLRLWLIHIGFLIGCWHVHLMEDSIWEGNWRKLNLTGIQCFSAAAYVKLKNTGKLDKWGLKGYQIYWPQKCAISIEHNVTFNPGDSFKWSVEIINGEEQSKVLQYLTKKTSEIPAENQNNQNLKKYQSTNPSPKDPAPLNISTTLDHPIEASTPIVDPPDCSCLCDMLPEPELNAGCGFQARQEPGTYCRLNQGLNANIIFIDDLEDELHEPGRADQHNLAKNKYLTSLTVGLWLAPWMKNLPLVRRLLRDPMVRNREKGLKKR